MKTMASCALLTLFAAAPAAAGVSAVWAVSDGDKVARDARRHPLAGRNAVWDGTTVRPCAARNEIVAFQVIVEADGSGIRALSAALPELRRRGGASGSPMRRPPRTRRSTPGGRSSSSPCAT